MQKNDIPKQTRDYRIPATRQNRTFKKTPIPHRTKSGEPMSYYVLSEDGNQHSKVTRAICLTLPERYDSKCPQRWFVDEESGLVVRLPRNELGENIARENMRSIWREEKYQERKCSCVTKGSPRCPKTCSNCPMFNDCKSQHKEDNGLKCFKKCEFCNEPNTSRTVDLDMFFGRDDDGDGAEAHYEPADPSDIEAIVEDTALLSTLNAALAALSQEDRDLIRDIFWHGKTERQLAPQLGLKEPKSVNKRKHRILEILRQNKALKEFLD